MKRLLITVILFAAVLVQPTQGDFFQCPPACNGTDRADVMNGSPADDHISGSNGNDFIFGAGGQDELNGNLGNDVIFGGSDWDDLYGEEGNDIFLPGPDGMDDIQDSSGEGGNDTFIVFVGETANCQRISGYDGFDVLHLIGFGPYSLEHPFGLPEPIPADTVIAIQDPVAGGYIIVNIEFLPVERINGLPSPNVVVFNDTPTAFTELNCMQP